MAGVDVEDLLREISEDAPCGPDLEYDPDFGALERAAQGKPEQQMGETIIPAEAPDWGTVQNLATDLLARSKDLRVARCLAEALAHTEGFQGLGQGLALLRGLLERHWDGVHPQLDPDDDNDPTLRLNILAALCDADGMLTCVRRAPLVHSRGLGVFSLRHVQLATGVLEPSGEGESVPNLGTINGAFAEAPLEEVEATASALESSMQHLQAIGACLAGQVGAAQAPDLGPLERLLQEANHLVAERLVARGGGADAAATVDADPAGDEPQPPMGGNSTVAGPAATGAIRSREDVVRVLDRICEFYARSEPSSPVPILLQRAKRLVFMGFMDIVRDLAPDGLPQLENIRGPEEGAAGEEGASQGKDDW